MKRLFKKAATPLSRHRSPEDLRDQSSDELLAVISDLESVIAEHESTNAFLRDLLTERWFDVAPEEGNESRSLQHL